MPYIDQWSRDVLDPAIDELNRLLAHKTSDDRRDGAVNYTMQRILAKQFPKRYAGMARVLGCLEAVKLEFYRRVAAPYEDRKVGEVGDIKWK